MRVFGSSTNLTSFERYGLKLLYKANLDWQKAFADVTVYLGDIFSEKVPIEKRKQTKKGYFVEGNNIYDTEIERHRDVYGERAVQARFYYYLCYELGFIILRKHLPMESSLWKELEKDLGHDLDYNRYYLPIQKKEYCPAFETVALLFEAAVKNIPEISILQVLESDKCGNDESGDEHLLVIKSCLVKYRIEPHFWRRWLYKLWDQNYDWGRIQNRKILAEANGNKYLLSGTPSIFKDCSIVILEDFLKAHGFNYKYQKNDIIEYWR